MTLDVQRPRDAEDAPAQPKSHGLSDILSDLDVALYHWIAGDDGLRWSANAPALFSAVGLDPPGSGTAFSEMLPQRAQCDRDIAIAHAVSGKVAGSHGFDIIYDMGGDNGHAQPFRFEERARLIIDADGTLRGAHGLVRRLANAPRIDSKPRSSQGDVDPLTGTLNRTTLTNRLASRIGTCRKAGQSCGFFVAAIDNLGMVNDSFGFEVADSVIAETARRISNVLRRGDVIGRVAGNKFGILLSECSPEEANHAARRICEVVAAAPVKTHSAEVLTTVSIGCVIAPRFAPDAEKAVYRAMEALQEARRNRRSGYKTFEPDTRRDARRKNNLQVATDLLSALAENRLGVALQPIVDSKTHEVAFHEALVRVRSRDGEDIPAGSFMPLAEQLGLVQLIDTRMVDLSTRMLIADPDLKLSLNVGVSTALDPAWFERITNIVIANRGIAKRMIIEITETEAIQDLQETAALVAWLHDLGCRVALDDFGAGYTTYRNLRDLGVDMVKIDGAFMRNLHRSHADQLFVQTLVNLSHNLGIETVAEWVEDERDAKLLQDWDVTYMQGHLYGRAVTTFMPGETEPKAQPGRVVARMKSA